MPRARTGSVQWNDLKKCWVGRVTLNDGARPWVDCPQELPRNARGEGRAREWIAERSEIARREGLRREDFAIAIRKPPAPPPTGSGAESCDDFFDRLIKVAKESGQTDFAKKANRWKKWISPVIGPKPIASVTRADAEDVRDKLDRAIDAWRKGEKASKIGEAVSGKTGMNVWSALTSTMKAATSSKRRELRVLDGQPNPCLGVEPPGDRDSRQSRRKTFLYPKEGTALLGAKDVPLEWRETYALALYLYLRPGELRVLRYSDFDFDAGHVSITRAWDYEAAKEKEPKTRNGVRKVPIEPALVPLLARMKKGRKATDLVVPALASFGEDHLAQLFRKHLTSAKVARAELHKSTRTHVQANFRSCRDSGITWLAMLGIDVAKIQRRAGHDTIDTTLGYVKIAEDIGGTLGVPFGPIPASLVEGLGPLESSRQSSGTEESAVFTAQTSARGGSRTPDLARMKRPL